jgi:rod shape determining protein RodA
MGVLRAEPARVTDWAQRSVGAVWRMYDLQLTVYTALLAAIGLMMAYTNSVEGGTTASALESGSTFVRGLLWAGLAIVAFIGATAFDYRWLRTFAWPLYGINLALLALTLAIGDGVGGSSRWVNLGPLTFQFSELAKILMIIVLADYLATRQGHLDSLFSILGACFLVVPPLLLVLMQPDLGTSLVFAAILAGMLFMSGASLKWLGAMAAVGIAAMPFIWTHVLRDYQKERITAFLNPLADIQGSGYQLYQAQIAVGSGGFLGKGLTNGTQSALDYLPVQSTDFVFAILAEELGFLGAIVLFILFTALLLRVLRAGWRSRDPFGLSFAAGLASMLLFQLFVNVGMVIGIMPITGIPLPFVTHGGASLISVALGLGIIQSINIRQGRAEW